MRFQKENVISLGIIPGPKKPKDLLSFLYPVVDEFKRLAIGVDAIDGSIPTPDMARNFLLKAYICVVGADMPARDTLMGLSGYNARHYCNYCEVRGIYSNDIGHMYCPLTPPRDMVPPDPDWRTYDPMNLPLRDHDTSMQYAEHVEDTGDHETTRMTGIATRTIFWDLDSIIFPWSYGLDAMHLFYQNVALRMRDHWAGAYPLHTQAERKKRRKTTTTKEPGGPGDTDDTNGYVLPQATWNAIENDMEKITYPTAFGDKPRSPLAVRKAAEWKSWVKVISPIVLQARLPEPYYREWVNLVKAITLATDYSIERAHVSKLRIMMVRFVRHYEDDYYQHKIARLPACRAVFHGLLHVADSVEWLGV